MALSLASFERGIKLKYARLLCSLSLASFELKWLKEVGLVELLVLLVLSLIRAL